MHVEKAQVPTLTLPVPPYPSPGHTYSRRGCSHSTETPHGATWLFWHQVKEKGRCSEMVYSKVYSKVNRAS